MKAMSTPARPTQRMRAALASSVFQRFAYVLAFFVVVALIIVAAVLVNHARSTKIAAAAAIPASAPVVDAAPVGSMDSDRAAIQAMLAGVASDSALGQLSGHITDVATGQELWSMDPDIPLVPASATKLATATAALFSLSTDDRVATTVLRGKRPGQIVLRGGGDITLQRSPDSGFFTDAPAVSDLASQAAVALGGDAVTSIVVDNSVRAGDLFNSTWSSEDVALGNIAPLGAVMVDAGRLNPKDNYSPRSASPVADAGRALAEALGVPGVPVTVSENPVDTGDTGAAGSPDGTGGTENTANASVLGTVYSATLGIRLRDMMLHSDNLLAEAIGREVAEARGKPQTFAGSVEAILEVLADAGINVDDAVLKDCSGMSSGNRLTARILDGVLALSAGAPASESGEKNAAETAHRTAALRLLVDTLPVAAADGTLADRYLPGSGAEGAAGRIRAKTGTLDGVNALAGTVTTDTGRVVTFAFLCNGADLDAGRSALDRLAATSRKI